MSSDVAAPMRSSRRMIFAIVGRRTGREAGVTIHERRQ